MRLKNAKVPRQFYQKLLHSPDVLRGSLRGAVRRRITSKLDYHLRDGYSSPCVQMDLKLTNACNLRCKMCGQWGESGWHLVQPTKFIRDTVPLETYKQMVDDVKPWWPWMFIYGGEPMLYRDFLPLTEYMKRQGLLVSVVTNGTMLEKMGPDVVQQGVDFVMVSIDGPRETHDEIRGMKGSYDRAVAGIAAVQEERDRKGKRAPITLIIVTISKYNTGNIDKVFELAEELGVDGMIVYYGYFQTEESCRDHELVFIEKLGSKPRSPRGWIWGVNEINTEELLDTIRRIRSRSWSFARLFAPDLEDADIPTFYSDHKKTFGYDRCVAPWMMAAVLPNGDVAPCRDYPDYVVGNIQEQRFTEMWNGERSRKFRTVLKEETLLPVCRRCCGLMDI